jgi:hypothetical protein
VGVKNLRQCESSAARQPCGGCATAAVRLWLRRPLSEPAMSQQPDPGFPQSYPRRIVLASLGLAPQVLTETLYRLGTAAPPFVPTEIHVVTTEEGRHRARLTLLDDATGASSSESTQASRTRAASGSPARASAFRGRGPRTSSGSRSRACAPPCRTRSAPAPRPTSRGVSGASRRPGSASRFLRPQLPSRAIHHEPMANEGGHFHVNSAARIFLGIALSNGLGLLQNLQATRARTFPDEEGIETVCSFHMRSKNVRAHSLMKKGLKPNFRERGLETLLRAHIP